MQNMAEPVPGVSALLSEHGNIEQLKRDKKNSLPDIQGHELHELSGQKVHYELVLLEDKL